MADLDLNTLNVNCLRDFKKRCLLFDYLKLKKFDVIFLQETLVASVEDCILWNKESNFKTYWSLSTSNWRLVHVTCRFKNCVFRCDNEGQITMLNCSYYNQDFRFISISVPMDGSQRIAYFENLDRYLVTRLTGCWRLCVKLSFFALPKR